MSKNYHDLYQRYLQDKLSGAELDLLLAFFQQAKQEEILALIDIGLQQDEIEDGSADADLRVGRVKANLLQVTADRAVRSRYLSLKHWYAAAAAILIFVGVYTFWVYNEPVNIQDIHAPRPSLSVKSDAGDELFIAEHGDSIYKVQGLTLRVVDAHTVQVVKDENQQVSRLHTFYTDQSDYKIILEDGSIVTLNAGSEVTVAVPFAEKSRHVKLSGEGFFDVAHLPEKPFEVQVKQTTIQVLGTQFNVRGYPEEQAVETALVRGKVALSQDGTVDKVILMPGQRAISNAQGVQLVSSGTKRAVAWTEHYFAYENHLLSSALHDISRWYGVPIDVTAVPEGSKIYMKIKKDLPLHEVMDLLSETSGLRYRYDSEGITIEKQLAIPQEE